MNGDGFWAVSRFFEAKRSRLGKQKISRVDDDRGSLVNGSISRVSFHLRNERFLFCLGSSRSTLR